MVAAPASRSIVDMPSRARPVWLVTRPTLRPLSRAKPSARSTSMPVSTCWTGSTGADPAGASARPAAEAEAGSASRNAEAAMVATRARTGVTSPLPSGWTRFDRKMTYTPVRGSIHTEVPVHPVWPKEPGGSSSPRFDE